MSGGYAPEEEVVPLGSSDTSLQLDDDPIPLPLPHSTTSPPFTRSRFAQILIFLFALSVLLALVFGFYLNHYKGQLYVLPLPPQGTRTWNNIRLPDEVLPEWYNMQIHVYDHPEWRFEGHTQIKINVSKPTNHIILHAKGLNITQMYLSNESGDQKWTGRYWQDSELEFLILECTELPNALAQYGGIFILHIDFQGNIANDLEGFYRSSYEENGTTEWLMVTDFEPTKARKAFPCFDEPAMKAIFKISISAPEEYNVLSNMPLQNDPVVTSNRKMWIFEDSKIMSTYLVCYCINKFNMIQDTTPSNITVRVWATPHSISQGEYALSVATTVIAYYENYFKINYPLPKLDLIAIPDFSSGAMENWGLITFRETSLLYEPKVSSLSIKKWVCSVIAHELAHQWFGNLVTMRWWDDLWLNEGFASFVEYIGMNAKEPSWNAWQLFSSTNLQSAFDLDALVSTHPISVQVSDPAAIGEIFDSISYDKGSSVLVMLRHYLNSHKDGCFEEGITSYLNAFVYKNAATGDLWNALTESCGIDVVNVMQSWTNQGGFPLLTFTPSSKGYYAHQSRFYLGQNITQNANPIWYIPFSYQIGTDNPITIDINKNSMELPSEINDDVPYVVFNSNRLGFYRVQYPPILQQKIIQLLNNNVTKIQVSDKVGFLSDLFAFEKSQLISPVEVLSSLSWLRNETNPIVWNTALSGLSSISQKISLGIPKYYIYQKYVRSLLGPMIESLTWNITNDDDFVSSMYKGSLFLRAGLDYEYDSVKTNALKLFHLFQDGIDIPTDLRLAIFCLSVAYGGPEEYFWILNRYNSSNVAAEKITFLYSLSCTRDPSLIQFTLDIAITPEIVRTQDSLYLIADVAYHGHFNAYLAWDFFKEHFGHLDSSNLFSMNYLVHGVTSGFTTQEKLDDVTQFFKEHPDKNIARAVTQAIEVIKNNIQWVNRNKNDVDLFLTGISME